MHVTSQDMQTVSTVISISKLIWNKLTLRRFQTVDSQNQQRVVECVIVLGENASVYLLLEAYLYNTHRVLLLAYIKLRHHVYLVF